MGKFLLFIGQRLMINNKNRTVRQSLIVILVNFFLLGGIVFILEVVLIILGVGDVFIPCTHAVLNYFRTLF